MIFGVMIFGVMILTRKHALFIFKRITRSDDEKTKQIYCHHRGFRPNPVADAIGDSNRV